jgi:hypothetical protein
MINKLFVKVLVLLEASLLYALSKNISNDMRKIVTMYRYKTIDLICYLKIKSIKE